MTGHKVLLKLSCAYIILIFILCSTLLFVNKSKQTSRFNSETRLNQLKSNGKIFAAIRDGLGSIIKDGRIEGANEIIKLALNKQEISMDECHVLLHLLGHYAYSYYNGDFSEIAPIADGMCQAAFQHGVEAQILLSSDKPKEDLKTFCSVLRGLKGKILCFHGAGHALIKEGNIDSALKFCDSLWEAGEDISDCWRGTFSEYANQALNYDGDTGLALTGPQKVKLDLNNPFGFCETLDSKYREACYSQLSKIYFTTAKGEDSIAGCLNSGNSFKTQIVCVRIVSGVYAQQLLSNNPTISAPKIILSLNDDFRKANIQGVHETFIGFKLTGVPKDYSAYCSSFNKISDINYCISLKV